MRASTEAAVSHQAQFHRRWNHLNDPHVRALAWLLDAPDLLDAAAPQWAGRIASIGALDQASLNWLAELDSAPGELHACLGIGPLTRLGRYAENLMAFYLRYRGALVAHGVQVRDGKSETIGEFDFLLRQGDALVHWEFATKLYLLEASGNGHQADYFVGPNLADTLGTKVRKIMDRQLSLSQHPAAQRHLPESITLAQALVKGWLFYCGKTPLPIQPAGISRAHCRGFWCTGKELDGLTGEHFVVLPRLSWLAPVKVKEAQGLDRAGLREAVISQSEVNAAPVLVARLEWDNGVWLEVERGFIVPDDWRHRAELRIRQSS